MPAIKFKRMCVTTMIVKIVIALSLPEIPMPNANNPLGCNKSAKDMEPDTKELIFNMGKNVQITDRTTMHPNDLK